MDDELEGTRRLLFRFTDNYMVSLRISDGSDGWLWHHKDDNDGDPIRYSHIVGMEYIEGELFRGVGFYILVFNLGIAIRKKGGSS